MAGLLGRMRRDKQAHEAALDLLVAFERLGRHAPAAAYLLGRTLHEARLAVLDDPSPREEKLELVEREIARAVPGQAAPDAGLSLLGLRLVRAILRQDGRPGRTDAATTLIGAVRDIARHGEGDYRALQARDREPPADEGVRTLLSQSGWTCVAEMSEAMGGEGPAPARPGGAVALTLAMCDVREEASRGRLAGSVRAIEAAIDRLG